MSEDSSDIRPSSGIREIKYSLREMLLEVEQDRGTSALGREMVDQGEIGNLFKRKLKGKRVRKRE